RSPYVPARALRLGRQAPGSPPPSSAAKRPAEPAAARGRRRPGGSVLWRPVQEPRSLPRQWQLNHECGALAWRAARLDGALMIFDDPVGNGEAQPRPVPDFLGREERVEDPLLQPLRDPRAGVGEREV